MAGHLSEQDVERYQRRALSPAELLSADDHLATCEACHQRVTQGRVPGSFTASLFEDTTTDARPDGDHLIYEQLARLVDDEVDDVDREIAMVHLESCRECAEALADLERLKSAPSQRMSWLGWPGLAAAALVVTTATVLWSLGGGTGPLPPDQPRLTSAPRIVVTLKDGASEITLDEHGSVAGLGSLSESTAGAAVKAALATARLNVAPALEGLRGKAGVLMGASGEGVPFALTTPLGIVVQSDRPTFRWRPLDGASSYVVRVYDTRFNEVARSEPQSATEWHITSPLARGVIYVWQVTATRKGERIKSPVAPAPEARFKVLERDRADEIERVVQAHANSRLVLGTVYAEAGLLDDADREFRVLLDANPAAQIAKDLLREVTMARSQR